MAKNHIKRISAPKTWNILRKTAKFVTRQNPGTHELQKSMPLGVIIKEVLGYASTNKEAKKILNAGQVKVDGKMRKDFRFPVGVFDTIEFSTGKYFRVVLDEDAKISLAEIRKEEAPLKPCKIKNKKVLQGKIQLNLYDGRNLIVPKDDYKVGDSLIISLPDQKISKHLKLAKNATIFLTGGKHIGKTGKVEDISNNKIIYKDDKNNLTETLKEYAFVIGDASTTISVRK